MRMPCFLRWPGHVPAGRVSDEVWSALDLLPTLAALSRAQQPAKPIDGFDVSGLWLGLADWKSPYDAAGFFYYRIEQLQAVRAGPWKLYLPLEAKFTSLARKTGTALLELFDVRADLDESRNVAAEHPDVVARLTQLADRARDELGDVDRPGRGQREAGAVTDPQPLRP